MAVPWGPAIHKAILANELDGVMVNVDSGVQLKVHEVAPHVLISQKLWLGHVYVLAINNDVWNILSEEDRQAIQRAGETAYRALGPAMDSSFRVMLSEISAGGGKVQLLDQAQLNRWTGEAKVPEIQANWMSGPAKDVPNAAATLEQLKTMLNGL